MALVLVVLAAGTVAAAVVVDSGGTAADRELADLEPALLTADDLGDEFEPDPDEDDGDGGLDLDDADVDAQCRDIIEEFRGRDDGLGESLHAAFERPDDDVSVQHELGFLGEDALSLDELAATWRSCDRIAYEDDGRPVEMRLSVDDVEGLGDEAIALTITADLTVMADVQLTLEVYGLMVVRDGVASSLFVTGPIDPVTLAPGEADRDLARELAATVDDRLQRTLN